VLWVLTGAVESDLWMNLHAPRDKKLRGERMKWRDGGLVEGGGESRVSDCVSLYMEAREKTLFGGHGGAVGA
jgi:hypothetical protein